MAICCLRLLQYEQCINGDVSSKQVHVIPPWNSTLALRRTYAPSKKLSHIR